MSKIKKANPKVNFPALEEQILKFWEENNILNKSIDRRPDSKTKTFYDGPITANGMPHHGHMLTFAIKDLLPRYWTMKGYKVERSLGWDCQGIPVEYEVEKNLGFKEKKDIERFGVAKFNELCRQSVLKYRGAMIELEKKMGRLTNDREEYATMDASYIESIWWSLKTLYEKGLLYEGFKVVPYSTRAGTSLSNAEVALGGYKPYVDPAVTVKFKLKEDPKTKFLAWTTTPWTLPTNFGLAVGKDVKYVKVNIGGDSYILAKDRVEAILGKYDYKIVEELQAKDLVGLEYQPLFNYFTGKPNAFKVFEGFHVTVDSGTGIVHLAPYGAEDVEIFKEVGIEPVDVLDSQGDFTSQIAEYAGMNYRDANPKIIEYLEKNDLLFSKEDYTHDMPMCWRTNTPLIYKPITSWYIAVSKVRKELVDNNERITWMPEHVKHGRFGNWLSEIKDWCISRQRYWGTPLPIWRSESGKVIIIGSFEELKKLSGKTITDPHRPFIDEIEFDFEGEHYTRIPDVLDVWYDSGAMPFARLHYPFENKEIFEKKFPAEFIAEGVDQTRGWFYTLHALGTTLFGSEAFKTVIMNGFILDDKGAKLSKSKKNYTDPDEMLRLFGADSLRVNFFSTPIVHGEDTSITDRTVKMTQQETMIPLWNIYVYLTTYADLHDWEPKAHLAKNSRENHAQFEKLENTLDIWMIARLQKSIKDTNDYLDKYQIQKAMEAVKSLLDDISKWYIRRNRDRFAEGDTAAMDILYYTYLESIKLLAPFAPFISEYLYQELVAKQFDNAMESIHLCDFPEVSESFTDMTLLQEMQIVREICTLGQSIRVQNRLKLRQPLQDLIIYAVSKNIAEKETRNDRSVTGYEIKENTFPTIREDLLDVIKDELNVMNVKWSEREIIPSNEYKVASTNYIQVALNTVVTPELREEGLYAEVKRQIQNLRKTSGLQMGESAKLALSLNDSELQRLIEKYSEKLRSDCTLSTIEFSSDIVGDELRVDNVIIKAKIS